ncbi:MAG: hypothetical protein AAFX06_08595 [Planctomycetota bacterium]
MKLNKEARLQRRAAEHWCYDTRAATLPTQDENVKRSNRLVVSKQPLVAASFNL